MHMHSRGYAFSIDDHMYWLLGVMSSMSPCSKGSRFLVLKVTNLFLNWKLQSNLPILMTLVMFACLFHFSGVMMPSIPSDEVALKLAVTGKLNGLPSSLIHLKLRILTLALRVRSLNSLGPIAPFLRKKTYWLGWPSISLHF